MGREPGPLQSQDTPPRCLLEAREDSRRGRGTWNEKAVPSREAGLGWALPRGGEPRDALHLSRAAVMGHSGTNRPAPCPAGVGLATRTQALGVQQCPRSSPVLGCCTHQSGRSWLRQASGGEGLRLIMPRYSSTGGCGQVRGDGRSLTEPPAWGSSACEMKSHESHTVT